MCSEERETSGISKMRILVSAGESDSKDKHLGPLQLNECSRKKL